MLCGIKLNFETRVKQARDKELLFNHYNRHFKFFSKYISVVDSLNKLDFIVLNNENKIH